MSQECARFIGFIAEPILPTPATANRSFNGSLVLQPGVYDYNDVRYDCTAEGLYTWFNPLIDTTNRIMYSGDIYALLSGLAWLCAHGTADEGLSDKAGRARTSVLRMRCGFVAPFVQSQLSSVGEQSRIVRILTADTPNTYDNGHVAIEVFHGGKWKLWDISNNCYFSKAGEHLSLKEMTQAAASDDFHIEKIAGDSYSVEPFTSSGQFDVTAFARIKLANLRGWVRRIYQIPGIDRGAEVWWLMTPATQHREQWVWSLQSNYRTRDLSTWTAAFY